MVRRELQPAVVHRTITKSRLIGWVVESYFNDYPEKPFMEVWFLTKRGAQRYADKANRTYFS